MIKIQGLGKLTKALDDAQKALSALDGVLCSVQFDPNDPASIEQAIQKIDALIDERIAPYASNSIVAPLVEKTKEHFRQSIIDKAAAERLATENP